MPADSPSPQPTQAVDDRPDGELDRPVTLGADAPPAAQPTAAPAAAPSTRRRGTLRDLVWSMAAVVAIVTVLVLLVPRPQRIDQPPADVAAAAASASRTLGFGVAVPTGLPSGWRATQAEVREGHGKGITTWRVTFLTPSQGWASVVQSAEWSVGWENREASYGRAGTPREIDGIAWTPRDLAERSRLTLVHRTPGSAADASDSATTIVTCACQEDELLALARSLQPAPGR